MPPSAKYLLLDTCIAEYWLDKYLEPVITKQLTSWSGTTFQLAISEVTYAEMVDGAVKQKVARVKELLGQFTTMPVTQRIFTGCGILGTVYKDNEEAKSGASLADKIIAATAFAYNLPVVTANVRDFPHPFFTSILSKNLVSLTCDHF